MTAALLTLCALIIALMARVVMTGDIVALIASAHGLFVLTHFTAETVGRP